MKAGTLSFLAAELLRRMVVRKHREDQEDQQTLVPEDQDDEDQDDEQTLVSNHLTWFRKYPHAENYLLQMQVEYRHQH